MNHQVEGNKSSCKKKWITWRICIDSLIGAHPDYPDLRRCPRFVSYFCFWKSLNFAKPYKRRYLQSELKELGTKSKVSKLSCDSRKPGNHEHLSFSTFDVSHKMTHITGSPRKTLMYWGYARTLDTARTGWSAACAPQGKPWSLGMMYPRVTRGP